MTLTDQAAIVTRLRAAGCVFAEEEAALLVEAATGPDHLDALVTRRAAGEPLEHLLGWVELCGLRFAVDPGVFVPRQRTTLLAVEAARLVRPGSVVLDLCCGCGALGGILAHLVPGITLVATDVDPAAVACARRNLEGLGSVYCGDLYHPLPDGLRARLDVIVANTPYVPSAEVARLPPEARDHEPLASLDGGSDGLDVQRRVAAGARDWLAPGGHLLVELAEGQVPTAVRIMTGTGYAARVVRDPDRNATVLVAQWRTGG